MTREKPSAKSIERLSVYRRLLAEHGHDWGDSVFSHQLAEACQLTAVQVRRDLMAVGYRGNPNKGYAVRRLLASIASYIDPTSPREVAIVGMGHLGRAISKFLQERTRKLHLVAAFDSDQAKIGKVYSGVPCSSIGELPEIIREKGIELGIVAVPSAHAQATATNLVAAGITGLLNFAPEVLRLPPHVYVESIDMSVSMEKVAFFARTANRHRKAQVRAQSFSCKSHQHSPDLFQGFNRPSEAGSQPVS
jgi:redox-sensing transcriptional repressor